MSTKYLIAVCVTILGLGTGIGMVLQKRGSHGHAEISAETETKEPENSLPKIAVANPLPLNAENGVSTSYFGEILSNLDGQIFAYREGVIERLLVDLGSHVRAGQVVALLSAGQLSPEYANMLAEKESMVVKAKAMVQAAETNLNRAKNLGASGETTTVEVVTQQQMVANTQKEQTAMVQLELKKIAFKARKIEVSVREVFTTIIKIFYGGYFQVSSPTLTMPVFGFLNAQTIIELNNAMSTLKLTVERLPADDYDATARTAITAADKALRTLDATIMGGDYTALMFAEDRKMMNMAKDNLVMAWNEYQEQVAMLKKTEAEAETSVSDQEQMLIRMRSEAESMLINARADLEAALRAREIVAGASNNREVRSPFSGTITQRLVNMGQKIGMSEPLFAIVQDVRGKNSSLFVRFEVPESELSHIKTGDEVKITRTQNPLQEFGGIIERLGTGINPLTRSIQMEARLSNPPADVLAHATVRVRLAHNGSVQVTVPRDSVILNGSETAVLVVRDETVVKQPVETARIIQDRVVISKGLMAEDQVILKPENVKVGDKVVASTDIAPPPSAEKVDMDMDHGSH